ncbi:MAG: hypothetical protein R3A13_10745 [Bdellovibrionota bacterium]
MDPITAGLTGYKAIQAVTGITREALSTDEAPKVEKPAGEEGGFEKMMKQLLSPDAANNVNEEELFSAVIRERLVDLKGEEAGTKYGELLEEHKASMTRADGYIPVEKAAKAALSDMVEAGELTVEEGDSVYSESFSASQLDDNLNALFDGRGSGEDGTVAVQSLEAALEAARLMVEKFASGEEVAPERSLSEGENGGGTAKSGDITGGEKTPTGNTFDGAEGFLWKPESESNGNLVVLLPTEFNDMVSSVVLTHEDKILEEGSFAGNEHNGARGHYRFNKAGGEYPDGLKVEVRFDDGTIVKYDIPDPSERYD